MKKCKNKDCPYCGGDIDIRNPTGKCDHLYYPENVNKGLKDDLPERLKTTSLNELEAIAKQIQKFADRFCHGGS